MARIRSIHPGVSTDETFMQMSMAAKASWPLLWTECDDQGVFEWKPVVLKARLLPADNIDFSEVLAEFLRLDVVKKFEIDGRSYGVVRNFTKFQRPKKPNAIHPLPPEYRKYAGYRDDISPPVPHQYGTGGENPPQMEDEGGRMEDEGGKKDDVVVAMRRPSSASYAFTANNIRLTAKDLDRWRQAFPHLALEAELWSLDDWAGRMGSKWFAPVSGALAKKERETVERANAAKAIRAEGGGTRRRSDGRI